MKIYFHSRKLQKVCSEKRTMQKELGRGMAKKLSQRMGELKAAETLSEISHLPPPRCHELTNRKGVYSVDLEHPYRLLFIPANDPVPFKEDGGISKDDVTEIEIIDIEDTHDPKNQRRN